VYSQPNTLTLTIYHSLWVLGSNYFLFIHSGKILLVTVVKIS
jgi:hypothetical protein